MKTIPLLNRRKEIVDYALVDDEDYEWLSQWSWFRRKSPRSRTFYAARSERGSSRRLLMHREILKDKLSDGLEVDHENHNGLDNQRRNIRAVTHQKNILNSQPRRGSTSSYLGVSLDQNGRWRAFIRGKHLGRFNSEEDAKDVVERFLRGDEQPVRIGLAKDLVACQYCGDVRLVLEPKAVKKLTCRDCMCACWLEADNTLFDPNKPVSAFFEAQEKGERSLEHVAERPSWCPARMTRSSRRRRTAPPAMPRMRPRAAPRSSREGWEIREMPDRVNKDRRRREHHHDAADDRNRAAGEEERSRQRGRAYHSDYSFARHSVRPGTLRASRTAARLCAPA